ncbi:DUF2891 family protein [Corynebacterium sp. HMSC072D12]|uniref:DUF2891 family protein n=1 Tax=Corynebacterium sp. HMSC072D12 TaxID=1739447 RepID=UPI00143B8C43
MPALKNTRATGHQHHNVAHAFDGQFQTHTPEVKRRHTPPSALPYLTHDFARNLCQRLGGNNCGRTRARIPRRDAPHKRFHRRLRRAPRKLHPSFYGCFNWHSSVHMQYSGTLLNEVLGPESPHQSCRASRRSPQPPSPHRRIQLPRRTPRV